ncbi:asparagine synthetase domain-containing protein 1 [Ixodes scapularis]|uniref:asparagine synthetase domain-containing protein 1 n=1 Tax=Ixodes scapularis TaxID=6945 RepID=UPI001A9D01BF|nr:asparagine synthetase domain-containing protein 1 [Ixodes scapularis]
MCGIGLCVKIGCASPSEESAAYLSAETVQLLKRRGPDGCAAEEVKLEGDATLIFLASVLGLRGRKLTPQPVRDEPGNVLVWNGEVFGGLGVSERECDTTFLLDALSKCSSESELLNTISRIKGPWALVYLKRNEQQLWFGRDAFGRRSLLFNVEGSRLRIVSCASCRQHETWTELPANGVYCLDLRDSSRHRHLAVRFFPWSRFPSGELFDPGVWQPTALGESLACPLDAGIPNPLNRELAERLHPLPAVGRTFFQKVLDDRREFADAVAGLDRVLCEAVRCRLTNRQMVCRECILRHRHGSGGSQGCGHATLAVLFSGGLDSMVIAALCARLLPQSCPIDLLNVAFQHQVHMIDSRSKTKSWATSYEAPDRLSARLGLDELRRAFPQRRWNLVEVNVDKQELQSERTRHIRKLIHPLDSVLDDSLGCALWFAARGRGTVAHENAPDVAYESPARVVLLGMGADEQLGGYSRHVVKYKNFGWQGLVDEISMELDRIATRNMGRDDRIVSDHGREPRFPFLDKNVVNYLNQIPIWMKVNPDLPRGVGDKLLLRLLAFQLGLEEAASRPKRAMQFGSRIVHAEEDRGKGSDVCRKLQQLDLGSVPESELAFC